MHSTFRPDIDMIRLISKSINSLSTSKRENLDFYIIFVSRKLTMCMKELERYNIIGEFKGIYELELDLLPLDHDVLTLEYPFGFRETCVEHDDSCLFQVARSIMTIQSYYGVIPKVIGFGDSAFKVITSPTPCSIS